MLEMGDVVQISKFEKEANSRFLGPARRGGRLLGMTMRGCSRPGKPFDREDALLNFLMDVAGLEGDEDSGEEQDEHAAESRESLRERVAERRIALA